MKATPIFILVPLGLASAFIFGSGVWGVYESFTLEAWFRIGFDAVLAIAGAVGLLTAMRRFEAGPVWAMTCVAGATLIAGLLANSAGGRGEVAGMTPGAMVRGAIRNPHAAARLAAGFVVLTLGGLALMTRSPRISFRRFGIGVGLLAPLALGAGLWFAGPLADAFAGLHPVAQTVLALLGFFAFVFLASAGGHFLIRALEAGVEREPDSADAP